MGNSLKDKRGLNLKIIINEEKEAKRIKEVILDKTM